MKIEYGRLKWCNQIAVFFSNLNFMQMAIKEFFRNLNFSMKPEIIRSLIAGTRILRTQKLFHDSNESQIKNHANLDWTIRTNQKNIHFD